MYFKGLEKDMGSHYDPSFVYEVGVWTVHPNPDTESKEVCGRGLHLCKRIRDIRDYVPGLEFVCLAKYRGKIAEDDDKIRVKEVLLTRIIPWAKLAVLGADYDTKLAVLGADWRAKRAVLDTDRGAMRAVLGADYDTKRAALYTDYDTKRAVLDTDRERKLRKKFFEEATEL